MGRRPAVTPLGLFDVNNFALGVLRQPPVYLGLEVKQFVEHQILVTSVFGEILASLVIGEQPVSPVFPHVPERKTLDCAVLVLVRGFTARLSRIAAQPVTWFADQRCLRWHLWIVNEGIEVEKPDGEPTPVYRGERNRCYFLLKLSEPTIRPWSCQLKMSIARRASFEVAYLWK